MFAKANDVERSSKTSARGKLKRLRIKKPSLVREGGPLAVDE